MRQNKTKRNETIKRKGLKPDNVHQGIKNFVLSILISLKFWSQNLTAFVCKVRQMFYGDFARKSLKQKELH